MSRQESVQAAKRINAGFMRGDMDDFVATMAEDVVFVSAQNLARFRGMGCATGAKRARLGLVNENPEIDVFDPSEFLTSENQVAAVSLMGGGLKKDGEKVIFPELVQVLTFDTPKKSNRYNQGIVIVY